MDNAGRNENIPEKRKSVFIGVPVFVCGFSSLLRCFTNVEDVTCLARGVRSIYMGVYLHERDADGLSAGRQGGPE